MLIMNQNFLKHSFYNLTSEGMISFLESNGMESVVERGDRAFPASHLASDVVDTLVRAAEQAGAEVQQAEVQEEAATPEPTAEPTPEPTPDPTVELLTEIRDLLKNK